jgi:hypothetical protein
LVNPSLLQALGNSNLNLLRKKLSTINAVRYDTIRFKNFDSSIGRLWKCFRIAEKLAGLIEPVQYYYILLLQHVIMLKKRK